MVMWMNLALAFNSFKFGVIADPHLSVPGPHSPANGVKMFKNSMELLQSTVEALNQVGDIDFVVVLGDLTKDAEPWNVDRFKEIMDELNEEAKQNMLAVDIRTWPRTQATPNTPQGNQKLLELIRSESTKSGRLKLPSWNE
jgi:3',5'-cyclic AMP phosphodiesterase CpdA